ncbi:MAG: helix-hairpin-helix domain-containing protein [Croceitalea sp.]|nr:helix-hairpin-helix domain-containing protein [Croceitalea sp.]
MKKFISHFKFNKREQSGIFFFLLIILLFQLASFFINDQSKDNALATLKVNPAIQAHIDSLKKEAHKRSVNSPFKFNPNFISDYKGYALGMNPQEIDRLLQFRKSDRYVNSADEFQKVTQISDSLLGEIAPLFKFPEWTQTNKKEGTRQRSYVNISSDNLAGKPLIKDINKATAEELKSINGIGARLSARIVKFRDRLGGFLTDDQLYDVYGLEPEVTDRLLQRFKVLTKPTVSKININMASVPEIAKLVYINYDLAYKIVDYRETKGFIKSFDQLRDIEGFPTEKLDRIVLYLSL